MPNLKFKRESLGGYSLIETLIYIFILVIIIMAVIGLVIAMIRAIDTFRVEREINHGAQVALERIVREIRSADSIDLAGSVFNTNPGQLKLVKVGTNYNFSVSNNSLILVENSGSAISLLPTEVIVPSLIFRHIIGSASDSVRIELTLSHNADQNREEIFYTTASLR